MRELILDTETTGLEVERGDRIIEVACIELLDRARKGRSFQRYVNPERDVLDGALKVHGITNEMLRQKPLFADVADDFLAFIGTDPLVIHNAPFDLGFLNEELRRCAKAPLSRERVVDTLEMARRKFPGARNSLDRLAERYRIDTSARKIHGGLIDAEILLEVYLELTESRRQDLGIDAMLSEPEEENSGPARQRSKPKGPLSTDAERTLHTAFIRESIGKDALWTRLDLNGAAPEGRR